MDILLIPFALCYVRKSKLFYLVKEDFHGNVNSVSGLLYTSAYPSFANQKHPHFDPCMKIWVIFSSFIF